MPQSKEKPYPSLSRIQPVSVDGVPTIGQANDKNIIDARGSLSARDEDRFFQFEQKFKH